MGLEEVRSSFSANKTIVEAKFAGAEAGHRFWLFVFNVLASCGIFLYWAFETGELLLMVCSGIIVFVFLLTFQVDEEWKKISDWRCK